MILFFFMLLFSYFFGVGGWLVVCLLEEVFGFQIRVLAKAVLRLLNFYFYLGPSNFNALSWLVAIDDSVHLQNNQQDFHR